MPPPSSMSTRQPRLRTRSMRISRAPASRPNSPSPPPPSCPCHGGAIFDICLGPSLELLDSRSSIRGCGCLHQYRRVAGSDATSSDSSLVHPHIMMQPQARRHRLPLLRRRSRRLLSHQVVQGLWSGQECDLSDCCAKACKLQGTYPV